MEDLDKKFIHFFIFFFILCIYLFLFVLFIYLFILCL